MEVLNVHRGRDTRATLEASRQWIKDRALESDQRGFLHDQPTTDLTSRVGGLETNTHEFLKRTRDAVDGLRQKLYMAFSDA